MPDFKILPTVNSTAVALANHLHPADGSAANLAAWYKADDLAALADGAAVTTWPDASGNGRDATQGTAANKPTFQTAELNGYPVVRFDGSNDYLQTATFATAIPQPTTMLVVFKLTTAPGALEFIIDGLTSGQRQAIYANTTVWRLNAGSDVSWGATDTAWHVLSAVFNGASSAGRIDAGVPSSGDPGSGTQGALTLGAAFNGLGNADVDIAELLLYRQALPVGDRLAVERYLINKYAIGVFTPTSFAAFAKWGTD